MPALALVALLAAAMSATGQATEGQGGPGTADRTVQTAAAGPAATDETKLLIPDSSGAAGAAAGAPARAPAPGVTTWDFVRMIVILALVVGIIYGVFWLLRRGQRLRTAENETIRILGSRGLGGSRALHLVEVGRGVYLVGSAENGVNLVAEVKDQETIDRLRVQAAEEGGRTRRSFAATLARVFSPPKASGRSAAGSTPDLGQGADFLRKNRERLRRLGGGR